MNDDYVSCFNRWAILDQVSKEAALCLKYNFLANGALDRNEVTTAIDYYDKAIATGYVDQEGVLLVSHTCMVERISTGVV